MVRGFKEKCVTISNNKVYKELSHVISFSLLSKLESYYITHSTKVKFQDGTKIGRFLTS